MRSVPKVSRIFAGGKEQERLGKRVIEGVQQRAEEAERAADAHAEGHDAHVLDAAVGEQALQVALHDHEEDGGDQRKAAKGEQQRVTEAGADGVRGNGFNSAAAHTWRSSAARPRAWR